MSLQCRPSPSAALSPRPSASDPPSKGACPQRSRRQGRAGCLPCGGRSTGLGQQHHPPRANSLCPSPRSHRWLWKVDRPRRTCLQAQHTTAKSSLNAWSQEPLPRHLQPCKPNQGAARERWLRFHLGKPQGSHLCSALPASEDTTNSDWLHVCPCSGPAVVHRQMQPADLRATHTFSNPRQKHQGMQNWHQ